MPITHIIPSNPFCEWCGASVLSRLSLTETHVQYMGGVFVGLRLRLCSRCVDMYEKQRSELASESTDPIAPYFRFGFADFSEECRHKLDELGIRYEVQYNLGQLSNVQVFFPVDLKILKTRASYIYQTRGTFFRKTTEEDVLKLSHDAESWVSHFDNIKPFSEMSPF